MLAGGAGHKGATSSYSAQPTKPGITNRWPPPRSRFRTARQPAYRAGSCGWCAPGIGFRLYWPDNPMTMKALQIKKVAFRSDKGVKCSYTHLMKKNVLSKVTQEIVADPFDETKSAMNDLRQYLLLVSGIDPVTLLQNVESKADSSLLKKARTFLTKRLTVTTVVFSYKDAELCGCKIGGVLENTRGEMLSLQGPYIHLDRESYHGFEPELKLKALELLKLVEQFLDGSYNPIVQDEPKGEHEEVDENNPFEEPKQKKLKAVA